MANLQYIGPRVVPKPYRNPDTGDAEWKSGIEYEALTMVTYLSNGYVSAKPVPSSIGNPADNPDYWVESADFDAALSDLQNRVHDLEEQNGNETLNTTAQTLSGAINEINNTITSNKLVVISDSFGITPSAADNFIVKLKGFLGLSNDDFYSSAEGGCGYANPSNDGHVFLDKLNSVITGMTTQEKADVRTLIVVGGVNDTRVDMNIDTYRTAVKTFFTAAKTAFPNAKMIAAYNGTLFHQDFAAARRALKVSFATQLAAKAGEAGAAFLPLNVIMSAYGATGADGIHPSSAGADCIAYSLINIMNGGGTLEISNTWSGTPFTFIGGTITGSYYLVNGAVLYNDSNNPINPNWLFTQLGTQTGIPWPTNSDVVTCRPFALKITHSDNTVDYKFDAIIRLRNDGIYELSIPSGSSNVVKIEVFAANSIAHINTFSEL